MIVVYIGIISLLFWYFFVVKRPEKMPKGPWFRIPAIGQAHYLGTDPIKACYGLRKKYGDIFSLEAGPFFQIMIFDLAVIEEMMSKDVFSGRMDLNTVTKDDLSAFMRGGHGSHGLLNSSGDEWKEQRRFTLRHLRDFGFGKSSMEETILSEYSALAENLREAYERDEEIESNHLFNITALNIIWSIITGTRLDPKDPVQKARIERLSKIMSDFSVNQALTILSLTMTPKCLRNMNPMLKGVRDFFHECFSWFENEYKEHEQTYDPDNMRDFTDVYIRERKRAQEENDVSSSFYGKNGYWSFVNVMFDLFLTGSETSSTSLSWTLLYLIHFPRIQRKLQKEIDSVVARSRLVGVSDRSQLPYLEAFMAEVQRHSMIAPFAVQHTALERTTFRGFEIPQHTVITYSIAHVLRDPDHFENPNAFNPDRFLKDGQFNPHPAMIAFGVGKRECLGKSLAKQELYLITANLLQQFNCEPGVGSIPGIEEANVGITRTALKFKLRLVPRDD